jgi:hypothetical protein
VSSIAAPHHSRRDRCGYSVVGETPNLAARLQALAEPDTVVIAAGTRRLLGTLFEQRDLGGVEVKGIGVPLFIEELTESVLESGVPLVGIPTTLHDSLMARLDRLASVGLVAQIGAAIGRQFPYVLLRAVSNLPEDELQASVARLVASELVFQRGAPPDTDYSFRHALVQDAAHGSLLRSTRQQLHAQIAEALETHSPELMDSQPELFAQHYAEAALLEKSVAYWGKAGRRSAARSAMAEAAAQFQKGLDELAALPDTPERRRQELEFCGALGAVLTTVKGYAAPETGHAYARARELWEQLGSPPEFLHIRFGQWRLHQFRGELNKSQRLAEDLLHLSRQRDDPVGHILGHLSCGRNLMFVGNFAASRSVHRRLRHTRSQRRQGAARRAWRLSANGMMNFTALDETEKRHRAIVAREKWKFKLSM